MAEIATMSNAKARAYKTQLLAKKKRLREETTACTKEIEAVQAQIKKTAPVSAIGKHAAKGGKKKRALATI